MTATARKADTEVPAIAAIKTGTVVQMAKRPAAKLDLKRVGIATLRNILPPLVVLLVLLGTGVIAA